MIEDIILTVICVFCVIMSFILQWKKEKGETGQMKLIDADAIDLRDSDPEVKETLDDAPTIKTVELYFSDLNEKGQKKLLDAAGVEEPSEINWDMDILPLATFEMEIDDAVINKPLIDEFEKQFMTSKEYLKEVGL